MKGEVIEEPPIREEDISEILNVLLCELDLPKSERLHTDYWISEQIKFVYDNLDFKKVD